MSPAYVVALVIAAQAAAAGPGADLPSRSRPEPSRVEAQTASPAAASSAAASDRPITHFFQNLGRDLAALPSSTTAAWLVVGAGGAAAVHPIDKDIHGWVVKQPATSLATFGNTAGDVWAQDGGALAVWAVGAATGATTLAHIGGDLIRAQTLVGVLVVPTKILVDRQRPNGGTRGFPSGHTTSAFATASVLQEHLGWKGAIPGYALAAIVGWSRVRSDNHWLSDVVFGGALGMIAGTTVTAGHRQSWTIVPAKTTGGAAVFFVHQPRG